MMIDEEKIIDANSISCKIATEIAQTQEEIIFTTLADFLEHQTEVRVSKQKLIDAIEAYGEYRWHDMRKKPNDLPTKDGYYLCIFEDSLKPEVWCYCDDVKSFGEWRKYYHCELDSCSIETYFEPFDEEISTIAWQYIKPFKEADV